MLAFLVCVSQLCSGKNPFPHWGLSYRSDYSVSQSLPSEVKRSEERAGGGLRNCIESRQGRLKPQQQKHKVYLCSLGL
jgi:hypothetical protein